MPSTAPGIAGVWKLKVYSRRFLDTGEIRSDMLPHAYIIYTPGGHMMSVTVEENRQPPAGPVLTDEERISADPVFIRFICGLFIGLPQ